MKPALREFMTTYLKDRLVVSVEDLENAVAEHFADRLDMEPMPDKARLKWQNETDWIKSEWTRNHATCYVTISGMKHVVWLPKRGRFDDSALCDRLEALNALDALVRLFPTEHP